MRHRRIRVGTTVVAAVLVPLLGLSACGSDDKDDSENSSKTSDDAASESSEPSDDASTEEESATEESSEEEDADTGGSDAASDGSTPAWALPVTKPGELLTTAEAGDVTVEIYQVGKAKATDDGMFVDPDTKKPILQKGDQLVFVNYVITNSGDPIDLGSSRVSIEARYDDWKWMQGMGGDNEESLYEAQDVNPDRLAPGGFNDEGIYTFGTGQTYSYGENFPYQKNSPITFDVTITPVDAKGDLLHDDKLEAEVNTKIK